MVPSLFTPRLELTCITLALVEAVLKGDRAAAERAAGARLPGAWPGKALIERAFTVSLERIRADPAARLWGDRLMLSLPDPAAPDAERRVLGSVIFHGQPDAEGLVEVGYGVEEGQQGKGYATEAVGAAVTWALAQPQVLAVQATTLPFHIPSIRVLEKIGMHRVGERDHETLGELIVFEIRPTPAR
jgi:RimJ/RimL family protein N-acetyltransferase